MVDIASSRNSRLKLLRSLLSARGIRKQGLALFSGRKIIPELIVYHADKIRMCDLRGNSPPPDRLPPGIPVFSIAPNLFDTIDPAGTHGPILVTQIPPFNERQANDSEGVSLIVGFQDPVNVGAAIRLSAAFHMKEAVILKEAANPFLPRSIRAAGPSVLTVPLLPGPGITDFSSEPLPLIALSVDGDPIHEFEFPPSFALLAGLEGPGLPHTLTAHATLSIPMAPGVESINAATALAIALYAYRLQHPL